MQNKPFFINSNICLDKKNISTYKKFMNTIAGNTGNSYITYSLIKEIYGGIIDFKHIPNIYNYDFYDSDEDIDYINNVATHVFLILQDQIRISESYGLKLPYKDIMNFISKINKPIIIAGLGANSFEGYDSNFHKKISPELKNFLKFISEHCNKIGIRGYFTEEVLHKIGITNTRVIGCPSFYENGYNRIIEKKEVGDISSILLTQDLSINTESMHKILQDFQEEKLIKQIAFNKIYNNLATSQFKDCYSQKYHIFSNIEDWKNFVKSFRFAYGNRLHGSILSINSGVPALCTNGDSRATEMCEFLKIPHNSKLNIQKIEDLLNIYENIDLSELNNSYPSLYQNFSDFLNENDLTLFNKTNNTKLDNKYFVQPILKTYSNRFRIILIFNYISMLFFSIKNEQNHKIINLFGIKMKFRRK